MRQAYDSSVDMWAIGVVAFMLLSGKRPFHSQDRKEKKRMIMQDPVSLAFFLAHHVRISWRRPVSRSCPIDHAHLSATRTRTTPLRVALASASPVRAWHRCRCGWLAARRVSRFGSSVLSGSASRQREKTSASS